MRFSSVVDTKLKEVVGLLIEQDAGGVVGVALAGEQDHSGSCARVVSLIMSRDSVPVEEKTGKTIRIRNIRPGEAGYAAAVCRQVGPPLATGPSGVVSKVGSPEEMLQRVWRVLTMTDTPAPIVDTGRLVAR